MGESADTRALCRKLEAKPFCAMTYPLIGSERQPPGWPDRYLAWRRNYAPELLLCGWQGFVEFKREDQKLKPRQLAVCSGLTLRGARVVVVRFWQGIYQVETLDEEQSWTASTTLELMRAIERADASS